jgi:sialidase-1
LSQRPMTASAQRTMLQYPFGTTTLIDTNKTCFSCFRIPTVLAGQTPGVIHAFAEGRRAGNTNADVYHCPDAPDTRLVYKRSSDYGATWSPGSVFLQDPKDRAENVRCSRISTDVCT